MTAQELAERWQVKKEAIYRLAREGKIPVVRLGSRYRFDIEQIKAFEQHGGTKEEK